MGAAVSRLALRGLRTPPGAPPRMDLADAEFAILSGEGCVMAVLTVRNLPDEVHRALRMQAAKHGRSTEAEVLEIIAAAVVPEHRVLLGDALASLGRELALSDDDIAALDAVRDRTPAIPPSLP